MPTDSTDAPPVVLPALSMPKGGGAIRGMGEQVTADPMTGTAALSVPIGVTAGRSNFTPEAALRYDSGAGSGIFGLGWSISLPAITRRTDTGVPQYHDAEESDTFVLNGADDLVPELRHVTGSGWERVVTTRTVAGSAYRIRGYRPRTEAGFHKIERWTPVETGQTHWRVISRDNVTTIYGDSNACRVEDPEAPQGTRVFSWLISQRWDDRGNWMVYEYRSENSENVETWRPHEHSRSDATRSAARHLKRIKYGNRVPRTTRADPSAAEWMFELVFDYGEHDKLAPTPVAVGPWDCRRDPFANHRAGFEVRTYRLCQRALMFHHFPDDPNVGPDCLVRSTDFTYLGDPAKGDRAVSLLGSVTQVGYRLDGGRIIRSDMPPVEFGYSVAQPDATVHTMASAAPGDLGQGSSQGGRWVDLDGDGLSGWLSVANGSWYYRTSLGSGQLGPSRAVTDRPATADRGGTLLLDLAGDGQLDAVSFDDTAPGFYERTGVDGWTPMRSFESVLRVAWDDPGLALVDLTGDGLTDVMITQDDRLIWYRSQGERGFGEGNPIALATNEEEGPRHVGGGADDEIFLADMSGDGLADLVRVRSGHVCYWPNLGYGRFGRKITMDGSPIFDAFDVVDRRRVLLVDADGTGPSDLVYLDGDGAVVFVNEAGNQFSEPRRIEGFPRTTEPGQVSAMDLLGDGTGCLVWSSGWPGDADRPVRYIRLTGGIKPHLITTVVNNVGAETELRYVPSTKFFLADRAAGRPWVSRLPFPVHVVEQLESRDLVSGNRFVSTYTYHHGHFDGVERKFCGFGRVDQVDTGEFGVLDPAGAADDDNAVDAAPVLTRTWFHTGLTGALYTSEYYREADAHPLLARATVLAETVTTPGHGTMPWPMTAEEARQGELALRGAVLREEVYALDRTARSPNAPIDSPGVPLRVIANAHAAERMQPVVAGNRYAVFFGHVRESVELRYEQAVFDPEGEALTDPRITHDVSFDVDAWGNVTRSAQIAYGRRVPDDENLLGAQDRDRQSGVSITVSERDFTDPVIEEDARRTPLPCESRVFELLRTRPAAPSTDRAGRPTTPIFDYDELRDRLEDAAGADQVPAHDVDHLTLTGTGPRRRLVSRTQIRYRADDLTGLLPLRKLNSRALPGETFRLAFTPELLATVLRRDGQPLVDPNQPLDPKLAYVELDGGRGWWIPSGRTYFHPDAPTDPTEESGFAATELEFARAHFFLPHRVVDAFRAPVTVEYDAPHHLNVVRTRDAVGNTSTADYDYRVLSVSRTTDANGNRSFAAYDCLGTLIATAVTGKADERESDNVTAFVDSADLSDPALTTIQAFSNDPIGSAPGMIAQATTRIVYDPHRFRRCRQPVFAAALARETHVGDPGPLNVHVSMVFFDGFGRRVQSKVPAEPGDAPARGPTIPVLGGEPPTATGDVMPGPLLRNPNGSLITVRTDRRWVGKGRTVYNNKGLPVLQFEPFFSSTSLFEDDEEMTDTGVSPVSFYDALGRIVATLRADHSYDKVVIGPWHQKIWDANDTVLLDPRTDADVAGLAPGFFAGLPQDWLTWHQQRIGPGHGTTPDEIASAKAAARQTERHADTPLRVYFDPLGRTFLTLADDGSDGVLRTRTDHDIAGNQRRVTDARGIIVERIDYDLLSRPLHTASPDAGQRWTLPDASGAVARSWDSQGRSRRMVYDALHRGVEVFVTDSGAERLDQRTVYGESAGAQLNHRGRVHQIFDGSGRTTNDAYDFKGNLLQSSKQMLADPRAAVDWPQVQQAAETLLEAEVFTSVTRYDALDRVVQVVAPHSDDTRVHVVRQTYNAANLVEAIAAWIDRPGVPDSLLDPAGATHRIVTNIDYDALGRRALIEYGNGVKTVFDYDPQTMRLSRLRTARNGSVLQELGYTFDPVGNVTTVRDPVGGRIIHNGQIVTAGGEFRYDALYRLTAASGREHRGGDQQVGHDPSPRSVQTLPADGQALRNYVETYRYDAVGNILAIKHHQGRNIDLPGTVVWHRRYQYALDGNRLLATSMPSDSETLPEHTDAPGYAARYSYDAHGNTTAMSHVAAMAFDDEGQLQRVDLGGGGIVRYTYDASGQRAYKVWDKHDGLVEERIYLGGFEVFRRRRAGQLVLERETLSIDDGSGRIALIENRSHVVGADPAPARLVRFQHSNHLGSVSLELDATAAVISYEEYHPFGSTAYSATRSQLETPRRYRHSGKERDEETGFYYYGARYFAPWTGRWISCDPAGLIDGSNLYAYARNNPISSIDRDGRESGPSDADVKAWMEKNPEKVKTLRGMPYSDEGLAKAIAAEMAKDRKALPASTDPGCRPLGGVPKQAPANKPRTFTKPPPAPGPDSVTVRVDGVNITMSEETYDILTAPDAKAQARDVGNGLGGSVAAVNARKAQNEALNKGEVVKPGMVGTGAYKPDPPPLPPPPPPPAASTARAQDLLSRGVKKEQQNQATVSVASAVGPDGRRVNLVASTVGDKFDSSLLQPGEVMVTGENGPHAEVQIMRFARANGYQIIEIYPSRPFCGDCAFWTRNEGALPNDATVAAGPGRKPTPAKDMSNTDLANRTMDRNPRYGTHDPIKKR